MLPDLDVDALAAYYAAQERVERLRAEWRERGEPVTAQDSRGQVTAHPLLEAMNRAESVADRLRQSLRPRHPGPDPRAVIKRPTPKEITRTPRPVDEA